MIAQIIQKAGKKEFAVIPYKDFLRMQEELEQLRDLQELRKAKADPKNQRGRPIEEVAAEMGIKLK
jgi:PHD/YefM family antitoxin component YafN of YafNO toxin-antitoxin module